MLEQPSQATPCVLAQARGNPCAGARGQGDAGVPEQMGDGAQSAPLASSSPATAWRRWCQRMTGRSATVSAQGKGLGSLRARSPPAQGRGLDLMAFHARALGLGPTLLDQIATEVASAAPAR